VAGVIISARRTAAALALLTAAAGLPLGAPAARAAAPAIPRASDTGTCAGPAKQPYASGPVRVALDWSPAPQPPGVDRTMTVHVTNTGDTPTTASTEVVLQLPPPNAVSGPDAEGFRFFGTGGEYTVPAGLAAHTTISTVLQLTIKPEVDADTVIHCDVSSYTGDDHTTVPYDLATGDPVVQLSVLLPQQPITAAPGATVQFQAFEHNAGPSIAYDASPTVLTLTAPAHTRWADPLPYGCDADAARAKLTCSSAGSPLTWRDTFIYPSLTVDPDAAPGAVLTGGSARITNHWDCNGGWQGAFTVTVSG
jgi:hypothetical protein